MNSNSLMFWGSSAFLSLAALIALFAFADAVTYMASFKPATPDIQVLVNNTINNKLGR